MMTRDFSALLGMSAQTRSLSFEERVRLIRIETFFGHATGNMLGITIATLVFAFVLYDAGQAPLVWGTWALLVLCLAASLAIFEQGVAKVDDHGGTRVGEEGGGIVRRAECVVRVVHRTA